MHEHGPSVILVALAMAWMLLIWVMPLKEPQLTHPTDRHISIALMGP
jgi:hypothetical protein